MGISKITRNFQVTLPRDVREFKKFKVGDKVLFVIDDKHLDIVRLDKNIVRDTAGIWNIKETGVAYERRLRKAWRTRPRL